MIIPLYAGKPEYPVVRESVTIHRVRIISRQRPGESQGKEPQRLNEGHPERVMIQSELHGDMQRLAETTSPRRKPV